MMRVVSIVEGDGEVQALPILLRRLNGWLTPEAFATIEPPIRVHRDKFIRRVDEFNRILLLAAKKCTDNGWILILLDADDDCPVEMAEEIRRRAREVIPHRSISVVLAHREFEAWFMAAARSLIGCRNFHWDSPDPAPANSETLRNAKGWLAERMGGQGYHETLDQPKFASAFDMEFAQMRSRSFRKLCEDWSACVAQVGRYSG